VPKTRPSRTPANPFISRLGQVTFMNNAEMATDAVRTFSSFRFGYFFY